VTVETSQNTFTAKFAIIAMPPHLAGRIIYHPPLPPQREQLTQRVPMGCCAKILISYEQPFWRKQGLAGVAQGNCQWLELCADSSDPETGIGVIATFLVGDRYSRWRSMSSPARRAPSSRI